MTVPITRLVTNFSAAERTHVERAIAMFEEIYEDCAGALIIKDDAYDRHGNKLPRDNALRVVDGWSKCLNNFWNVYLSLVG